MHEEIKGESIYGSKISLDDENDLHVSAIKVNYPHREFTEYFLSQHPPTSPAYISYFNRISNGLPFWAIEEDANRL